MILNIRITKEFIENNLFNKNKTIDGNKSKLLDCSVQELYNIYFDITEIPKCYCGNELDFLNFKKGYRLYCSSKCSSNSEDKKIKMKQTCIERYGVENPYQSELIKNKIKQSCIINYGVENPMHSDEIKDKFRQTCLITYGVENPSQSDKVKSKKTETSQRKYGVDHHMQVGEIADKCVSSCYKSKYLTMPSGRKIIYQGFEDKLILELLLIFNENDIITERKHMPTFWYFKNGKKSRYYPDVYIPKNNTIYEVKSEYTYNQSINSGEFELKKNSVINQGYYFELKIY